MNTKNRMLLITCGILGSVVGGLVVLVVLEKRARIKYDEEVKPYLTYTRLMYTARRCDDFYKERGHWPKSLSELREFGPELSEWAVDMWQRDLVFAPYTESQGCGRLISYGRDGVPGGRTEADLDIEVRFPLAPNESWNLKAGEGLKKPYLRVGQILHRPSSPFGELVRTLPPSSSGRRANPVSGVNRRPALPLETQAESERAVPTVACATGGGRSLLR